MGACGSPPSTTARPCMTMALSSPTTPTTAPSTPVRHPSSITHMAPFGLARKRVSSFWRTANGRDLMRTATSAWTMSLSRRSTSIVRIASGSARGEKVFGSSWTANGRHTEPTRAFPMIVSGPSMKTRQAVSGSVPRVASSCSTLTTAARSTRRTTALSHLTKFEFSWRTQRVTSTSAPTAAV